MFYEKTASLFVRQRHTSCGVYQFRHLGTSLGRGPLALALKPVKRVSLCRHALSQERENRFFAVEIWAAFFGVAGDEAKLIHQKRTGRPIGQSLFKRDNPLKRRARFHIGHCHMGRKLTRFHLHLRAAGGVAAMLIKANKFRRG